jgi:hypothetical protein
MSELWRRKAYYRPRILIEYADIVAPPFEGDIFCFTGAELLILRNLLAYANRRVTWVSEYSESHYLTPTTEEWDVIQKVVAELEDKLMAGCCDELIPKLDEILAAIQALDFETGGNSPSDLIPPYWDNVRDIDVAFKWGSEIPNDIITPGTDEARCARAQLWYQAGYELITESALPGLRYAFDNILPAAAALIAAWTGGLALPALMGVYAVAELLQELLEIGYNAAETNLVNWLFATKQAMVCEMYHQLGESTQVLSVSQGVYTALVAPSQDISQGDKLIWQLFSGPLALIGAQKAYDASTDWASYYVTPGYCDECNGGEIVDGSDWFAVAIPEGTAHLDAVKNGGSSWLDLCLPMDVAYPHLVGVVFDVSVVVGGCILKRMSAATAGCTPTVSMFPDTSGDNPNGRHFDVVDERINDVEAKAALAPTGTVWHTFLEQADPGTVTFSMQMGYNCVGERDIDVRYLVFAKSAP